MQTDFRKDDDGKPRWGGLVRLPAYQTLVNVIARNDAGAAKYGDLNWVNGTRDRYEDALMRHALALLEGHTDDVIDTPDGSVVLTHADAVIWNTLVLSDPRLTK